MTSLAHSPNVTRSRDDGKFEPEPLRKGVFWDAAARQYGCRIGYVLDESNGRRKRAVVTRLGSDPNKAIVKHADLMTQWEALELGWPNRGELLRPGLPESIRKTADLTKPVWYKPEWVAAATAAGREEITSTNTQLAEATTQIIGIAKDGLKALAEPSKHWLDSIPPELRTRVYAALAPAAHEAQGWAPDAKATTIRHAADIFLEYKKGKIGLKMRGRRSGGGIKPATYRNCEWNVNGALKFLTVTDDLRTLTHEKLETVIDTIYQAKTPATARNLCKHGLKQLLDWSHKRKDILYRKDDETDELFALSKVVSKSIVSYNAETVEKLKILKQAAEAWVENTNRNQPVWPFVLLAMNTGMYSVDIASLTYDNLKMKDGQRYLWWPRVKSEHQNEGLFIRHDLWPETWAAIEPLLAPNKLATNPGRHLFLSNTGKPLYAHATSERARVDVLGLRFTRLLESVVDAKNKRIELGLSIKQFRKIGLNAIKAAAGGSDDVARKFAGQRVPGVLKNYLVDDYDDVGEALKKWGEQLRTDGIL